MCRRLSFLILVLAFSCASPQPMGVANVRDSDGRESSLAVVVAAQGDNYLNLVVGTGCNEYITFRNYPSWQLSSCANCTDALPGRGFLSFGFPIFGYARSHSWRTTGDDDAELRVTVSNDDEVAGELILRGQSVPATNIRFRAPREELSALPSAQDPTDDLCLGGPSLDLIRRAACCNWDRRQQVSVEGRWPACVEALLCP
jgi:hypothetical protein